MDDIRWRPWEKKTFKLARKEQKPILLEITAKWSHACRIKEETAYRNSELTAVINLDFIPIKIDTDERPDINDRYNSGGWPTTALLRPDGSLIAAGIYTSAGTMLSCLKKTERDLNSRAPLAPDKIAPAPAGRPEQLTDGPAEYFARLILDHFDPKHGGFGDGPKFPMIQPLGLALSLAAKGDDRYASVIETTLTKMSTSEIFDASAGGFFRYSRNADWSRPQREKLLIDQAESAILYIDAFSLTGEPLFADTANKTLDFLEAIMLKPYGRFCASQASDESHALDKTVLSGWNARACSAFIKAESVLARPGAADIALRTLNFLFNRMRAGNDLFWHYFDGHKNWCLGLLVDQINVMTALLDAYEASANAAFIAEAISLAAIMVNWLRDHRSGAFFDRLPGREDLGLLGQPYLPIGLNARAAIAYIRLAAITDKARYEKQARGALEAFATNYRGSGLLAADYGQAIRWLLTPNVEVFMIGKRESVLTSELWKKARSTFHPHKVLIVNGHRPIRTPPRPAPRLTSPAALVCVGNRCLDPIVSSAELAVRLKEAA